MTDEKPLPEVQYADFPQRTCRTEQSPDGLNSHFCSLSEYHPGPCCPRTLASAIRYRAAWEAAHPGWEKTASDPDPYADITKTPGAS